MTAATPGAALGSGSVRLALAAALCVVSLGVGWGATPGSEGYVTPGYIVPNGSVSPVTGEYSVGPGQYYAGTFIPGTPGAESPGYESDARVLLVPALVGLVLAARRRTGDDRAIRLARRSTVALAVAAVLAVGTAATTAAVVATIGALVLAASVTWPPLTRWVGRRATERPVDSRPTPQPAAPTAF